MRFVPNLADGRYVSEDDAAWRTAGQRWFEAAYAEDSIYEPPDP
jgi:hypothetical protein